MTSSPWGATRRRALLVALVGSLVGLPRGARAQPAPADAPAPGEARLLERLIAPCCWIGTLDSHESPLATELRTEVRARLRAGEAPQVIEDDLVARYGERVRAVPRGRDPRQRVAVVVGLAALVSGLAVVQMLRRWSRTVATPAPPPLSDAEEARLEEELRRLDAP
jgi:cytochrome c-type biogenesis protein CcmH